MIRFSIIAFIIITSFEVTSQCLTATDILIRTSNSCSSFDNGVLIFRNLKAKTPYNILVNDRVYSYTANDSGTLNIYSLAPGTYENITINDRTNPCPEIKVDKAVTIEAWNNIVEGPISGCKGETLQLNSSSVSTWTINSSIINFNATETSLTLGEQKNITVVVKALIEGCYERDTLHIKVEDAPQINLIDANKSYCYNKQNELVELNVSHGHLTEVLFNGELISTYDSTILQLNLGDVTDDNTLSIAAENDAQCESRTNISLAFSGEAPKDDIEIIWWPGNIFSVKNENPQLNYQWGWINARGELSYAITQSVSSDGKHYFAGNQSIEVNDLVKQGEASDYILFLEYRYEGEECFNRLMFNSAQMPLFRNQAQQFESGIHLSSFPNPFTESMTIASSRISGFEELQIRIFDSSGKLFKQRHVDISNGFLLNVNTTDFPPGTYFIQLSHQGYTLLSNKVIKQ